ncbi:MAG TPA: hypothetical protein VNZ86_12145 [Bacteroidia bacterium]|nr:hypothetical protein [Bacteroidia bacterium]
MFIFVSCMGILILSSLFLSSITVFPLITANLARRMGRPFIPWFILGFVLPVISIFIVFFLPDKSEKKA